MSKITAREAATDFRDAHVATYSVDGEPVENISVGYGFVDFVLANGSVVRHDFDDKVTVKTSKKETGTRLVSDMAQMREGEE